MNQNLSTKRLFVALPLPESVHRALNRIQHELIATHEGCRIESNLHLTLRFIGSVPLSDMPAIDQGLQNISLPPPHIIIDTLGAFHKKEQTVIWAGCQLTPGLVLLKHLIDTVLMATCKLPRESRPFKPHITLGRVRSRRLPSSFQGGGNTGKIVSDNRLTSILRFIPPNFVLFSSQLTSSGAVHHIEKAYPMAGTAI